jgi:hypothetical protein
MVISSSSKPCLKAALEVLGTDIINLTDLLPFDYLHQSFIITLFCYNMTTTYLALHIYLSLHLHFTPMLGIKMLQDSGVKNPYTNALAVMTGAA